MAILYRATQRLHSYTVLYTFKKFIDRRNTLELERSFDNRLAQTNTSLLSLLLALVGRGQHGAPCSSSAGQGALSCNSA